jgi:hemolysin III
MTWLVFREPVSAWTHFAWLVLSLPATVILLRRARGNWLERSGFLIFGVSAAACFGASWLYHAVPASIVEPFHAFDHVAIYLFIAGTVTPIALVVLRGRWRASLLSAIWVLAASGVVTRLTAGLSVSRATLLYLAMGWLGMLTYFELARRLTHARLKWMWAGGLLYTVGAVLNTLHWPVLVPGVFESHELFHLFVMAGAASHYRFMLEVVAFEVPQPEAAPAVVAVQAAAIPVTDLAPEAAEPRRYAAGGV